MTKRIFATLLLVVILIAGCGTQVTSECDEHGNLVYTQENAFGKPRGIWVSVNDDACA